MKKQKEIEFTGEPVKVDSEHLKEMYDYVRGFRDYLRDIPLEENEKPMTQLLVRIDTMRNTLEKYL